MYTTIQSTWKSTYIYQLQLQPSDFHVFSASSTAEYQASVQIPDDDKHTVVYILSALVYPVCIMIIS